MQTFSMRKQELEFVDHEGKVFAKLTVKEATVLEEETVAEMELSAHEENERIYSEWGELHPTIPLPPREIQKGWFRANVYPKLAACSEGDVPSFEEALTIPASELNKWYKAAEYCNPGWFKVFDNLLKQVQSEMAGPVAEGPEHRKKSRKRGG